MRMKKTLLTLVAILAMSATAVAQNIAELAGTYKGDLYISLGAPIDAETEPLKDQSIKIEAGEGKSINFALYNFSFGEIPVGDIILNNVGVKAENNVIRFDDEEPTALSFMGGMIAATAKINPTESQISGNDILVNLDVFWVQPTGDTPIYVRFNGKKDTPAAIEDILTAHKGNAFIYTLNGTRIHQTYQQLPKGIYIVNGKKIIK